MAIRFPSSQARFDAVRGPRLRTVDSVPWIGARFPLLVLTDASPVHRLDVEVLAPMMFESVASRRHRSLLRRHAVEVTDCGMRETAGDCPLIAQDVRALCSCCPRAR